MFDRKPPHTLSAAARAGLAAELPYQTQNLARSPREGCKPCTCPDCLEDARLAREAATRAKREAQDRKTAAMNRAVAAIFALSLLVWVIF